MKPAILTLITLSFSLAQDQPPPIKFTRHELPNGLKLILAEDHSRPVVDLHVWSNVGSKNERTGRTGFAHLFEHMMFRGSKNLGPEEHIRLLQQAGGNGDAYTTFDQTVYFETFPPQYLERMLWMEADRMASLVIDEERFKKEREVVKEERRMRYENPPFGMVFNAVLENAYQQYPYKRPPIGSMEDLNAATAADVQEFFDTYYVPNNATIILTGDFDTKEALAFARKHFGPIPRGKKPIPAVTATEPPQTELRERELPLPNIPLPAVVKAFHLPPGNHPDSYALEIAANILSAGQSSRLYRKLVYEDQLAVQASGQPILLQGPSLFFAVGIVQQGKDPKKLEEGMRAALDLMARERVSPDDLEKAKTQIIRRFVVGRQRMHEKGDALLNAAILRGDPAKANTDIAAYRAVTAEDVQRVCAKYFVPTNETRLWITGKK